MSGAELLVATMDGIESGELVARPQPADGMSLAPKITADDAQVHWASPASRSAAWSARARPARAPGRCWTAPGSSCGRSPATARRRPTRPGWPGQLRVAGPRVLVGTGTQPVQLGDVQAHGKRRMPAADWCAGCGWPAGAVLG